MAILSPKPFAQKETVTLSGDEIWQAQGGPVYVQTSTPSDETDGIMLAPNLTGIELKSGANVTYWLASAIGCRIVRMAR